MFKTAKGTFKFTAWDEKTWDGKVARDVQGAKLTHAKIVNQFSGDIEGESQLQYVMYYDATGKAAYHGLEQITGTVDGRKGSFVLHTEGKFDGKTAGGTWEVVPNSGTGDLEGISGTGQFTAQLHTNETPYELNYRIETGEKSVAAAKG